MKVVMIARATLYTVPGGDTVQITKTAEGLRKLGVAVEIALTNTDIDYGKYDLLHFFNIIRPADILKHIEESNKPYVVSPIFVDYFSYEKNARGGVMGLMANLMGNNAAEYLKAMARFVLNNEKIVSPQYFLKGHKGSILHVLQKAAMLLPNSESEYKRLEQAYGIKKAYRIIPNGIDEALFISGDEIKKEPNLILCVARIEGRKNQLNLIRAVNNSHYKLLVIGGVAPNHRAYFEACKKEAGPKVEFIEHIEQQDLLQYYQRAKVHVLPSWNETTGLSSLEAAAMGCSIVVSPNGDTRDYFGNDAFYCKPDSVESIRKAIDKAAAQTDNSALRHKILANFTWTQAAIKTLEAYKKLLG